MVKRYKESMVNAYTHYVKNYGLVWIKPVYKRSQRLPSVPSTEQVNKIIAHAGRKYALVFSILPDTGLRPIELDRPTLKNIDLELASFIRRLLRADMQEF